MHRFTLVCCAATALLAITAVRAQSNAAAKPELTPSEQISALTKAGQLQRALERADALLIKSPRDAQVRFLRAVVLADLGKPAEATVALEALIQDFPELPEPHNNLGVLLAAQGHQERARVALMRAIEAAPDYVTARENLGDLYVAMAAEIYRQVTVLDPKSTALSLKLAQTRELSSKLRTSR